MTKRYPNANATQRARRAVHPRIDYHPSRDALELIESRRTRYGRTNNYSGIIDTIIAEWAALAGVIQCSVEKPATSATAPELSEHYAHARFSPENLTMWASPRAGITSVAPELMDTSRARAGANNSGSQPAGANQARVICGARRRRDGEPCQGLSVPGKLRCKWHGGASTGPRTDEGRARSMANLRQYQGA